MIGVRGGGRRWRGRGSRLRWGRERADRDNSSPPRPSVACSLTGMSVPALALAMSLSIQILREALRCRRRTYGQEKSTWLAPSERGYTLSRSRGRVGEGGVRPMPPSVRAQRNRDARVAGASLAQYVRRAAPRILHPTLKASSG